MLKDELQDEKAEQLSSMMQEIIDNLVDGASEEAAQGLEDLANYYAKAGFGLKEFEGMRKYIVGSAINKHGSQGFIHAKLLEAEQKRNLSRQAHSINNIVKH